MEGHMQRVHSLIRQGIKGCLLVVLLGMAVLGCPRSAAAAKFVEEIVQPGVIAKSGPVRGSVSGTVQLVTSEDKLVVCAPTEVHVAVAADGTLLVPESEALAIVNSSAFGLHVSKMSLSLASPFQASSSNKANYLRFSLSDGSGAAVAAQSLQTLASGGYTAQSYAASDGFTRYAFSMRGSGLEGSTLELALSDGKLSASTVDLCKAQQFGVLSLTFAPGTLAPG
jgi:hypothetical protein